MKRFLCLWAFFGGPASDACAATGKGPAEGDLITLRIQAHVSGRLDLSDEIKLPAGFKSTSHHEFYATSYDSTSKWEVVGGLKPNSSQISLKRVSDHFSVNGHGGGGSNTTTVERFDYSDPKNPKAKRKATRTSTMTSQWRLKFPQNSPTTPARPVLSLKDKTFRLEMNSVGPDTPEIEGSTTITLKDPDVNQSTTLPGAMFGTFAMALGVAAQNAATPTEGSDPRLAGSFDPAKPFIKSGGADFNCNEYPALAQIVAALRAAHGPDANISTAGRLHVSYTLAYNCTPADLDAEIIPAGDYEKWLPAPSLTEGAVGNTLAFTLKLVDRKTGQAPKAVTATFDIQLLETSQEPGSCLNSSWQATTPDFRIAKEASPDLATVAGDGQTAQSKPGLQSCPLVLNCYDGAAYSRIKVIAHLSDGQTIVAHRQGQSSQSEVSLPYDENQNRVADAWEVANGVMGQALGVDNDAQPAGNGTPGDGLTHHEEYRGLLENGKYIRTDPRQKDLFIGNTVGAEIKPGIALFEQLTELKVHSELTAAELGEARIINRNKGGHTPHVVDQHGVRIVRGPDNSSMEAVGATANSDPGSPKTCEHIKIYKDIPTRSSPGGAQGLQRFHALVAHEICHAVAINHHGALLLPVLWTWIKDASTPDTWILYEFDLDGDPDARTHRATGQGRIIRVIREADGSELQRGGKMPPSSEYNKTLGGHMLLVLGKQSEGSGNESCIIRYDDRQAYLSDKDPALRIIPDYTRNVPADGLCDSPKGTGVNSPHNQPESRYGDAAVGNCKGQILVNDR